MYVCTCVSVYVCVSVCKYASIFVQVSMGVYVFGVYMYA